MSAKRRTHNRIPFLTLILLVAFVTAGCGGGGGGGVTGSPSGTVGAGDVIAIVAGRVESAAGVSAAPAMPQAEPSPEAAPSETPVAAVPAPPVDPAAAPAAQPEAAPTADAVPPAPSRALPAGVNATVKLYSASLLLQTTVTSNGYYQFNLSLSNASLLGTDLRVVVELVAGSTQVSVPVIPVQNRTVFSRIQVNTASNSLVDAKEVVSSEFGPAASMPTVYSMYFAAAGTGKGSIRGIVDVDASLLKIELDGATIGKSVSATAPYFTTEGTVRPGVYAYVLQNVDPGTRSLKATSGGKIITKPAVNVAALVATPGIDLLFNSVSTTLTLEKPATGSGDGQSKPVSTSLDNPLVVVVKENGVAKGGVAVAFGVISGTASLNPTVALTDAQGRAQTMVTFGASDLQVSVRASIQDFPGNFTVFTLTPIPANTQQGNPVASVLAAEVSDQTVTLQWSKAMSAPTVETVANYRYKVGGMPAFAILPSGTRVTHLPAVHRTLIQLPNTTSASARLAVGATIQFEISNVLDATGLPTSPATRYLLPAEGRDPFAFADAVAPTAEIELASSSRNRITLLFSEPVVGAGQITNYSVSRDDTGGTVWQPLSLPATVAYSGDSYPWKATLDLSSKMTLLPGDRVKVKIVGVTDGTNSLGDSFGFETNVVTASAGDTTPPAATIDSAVEELGTDAANRTTYGRIVVVFNKEVESANASLVGNYVLGSGGINVPLTDANAAVSYDRTAKTATITFKRDKVLAGGTNIRLQVANLVDLAGLPSSPSPFVTGEFPVLDKRAPTATIQTATDAQEIVLSWSEAIAAPVSSRFELSEDNVTYVPLNSIPATVVHDAATGTTRITYTGGYTLVGGANLYVRMNRIADLAGNTVQPNLAYVVGPKTVTETITAAPTAKIVDADNTTQKITLQFNKRMANATDRAIYMLSRDSGTSWRQLGLSGGNTYAYTPPNTLEITLGDPDHTLASGDRVRLMINGLTDLKGSPTVPATNYLTNILTVADKTRPRASILMANAESQVLVVEFDEPVTLASLQTAGSIVLSTNGGATFSRVLACRVTYDAATRRATLELNKNADGTDRVPATPILATTQTVALRLTAVSDTAVPANVASALFPVDTPPVSVAATSSPVVSSITATDGDQKLVIAFSKPLAFGSTAATAFEVSRNAAAFVRLSGQSTAFYDAPRQSVVLIVRDSVNFRAGDALKVRMDGIVDELGIPTWPAAGYEPAAVATALDTTPPVAEILSANDGDGKITLGFSEDMVKTPAETVVNYALSRNGGTNFTPLTSASTAVFKLDTALNRHTVTLTIEPALKFNAGDLIKIRMSGLADIANNATVPAANYEVGPLAALDTTPPTGDILLAEDGRNRIIVQFDEAVDEAAIRTQSNWYVNPHYASNPEASGFYRLANSTVTWTPTLRQAMVTLNESAFTLVAGRTLYVRIANLRDAAGNLRVTSGVSPAACQIGPSTVRDGTPPTASILSADPLTLTVVVQFADAGGAITGADVKANFQVSTDNGATWKGLASGHQLLYDPQNKRTNLTLGGTGLTAINFSAGDQIKVSLSDIQDAAGNYTVPPQDYVIGPFTAAAVVTTRPTALIFRATDLEQKIHLRFNRSVKYEEEDGSPAGPMLLANLRVEIGGVLKTLTMAGDSVTRTLGGTEFVITLDPARTATNKFTAGQSLRVRLDNVISLSGSMETSPATGYFTNAYTADDTTPPTAEIKAATDGDQKVELEFSEPVETSSAVQNLANYRISKDDGANWRLLTLHDATANPAGTSRTYSSTTRKITFTVGDGVAFKAGDKIKLEIQGITDANVNPNTGAKNPIADSAPFVTAAFTSTDTTKPSATSLAATDGDQKIVVQFSEPMKYGTGTGANDINNYRVSKDPLLLPIQLTAAGGSSVVYSASTWRATITVGNGIAFRGGDLITVQMSDLTDLANPANPTSPAELHAVTGTAVDTTKPTVASAIVYDDTQALAIAWSERVLNSDRLENYRIYRKRAPSTSYVELTALTGTSLAYNDVDRKTTLLLPAATFATGDVVRIDLFTEQGVTTTSRICDAAYNSLPITASNYHRLADFDVTDRKAPTATIDSAKDWVTGGKQQITLLWSEPVTFANTVGNYSVGVNAGAGYVWTALDATNATASHSNTTLLTTLTVNAGVLNFKGGNAVAIRVSNVRDNSVNQNKTVPETNYELAPVGATDTTDPVGQIVSATDGDQTFHILWSEPILPITPAATATGFRAYQAFKNADAAVAINSTTLPHAAISWDVSNPLLMKIQLVNQPNGFVFAAGDQVSLSIYGVKDAAGNATASTIQLAAVAASDTTAPTVTLHEATDSNEVTLAFNEELEAASATGAYSAINPTNYYVSRNGGTTFAPLTAASTATYDAAQKRVKISIGDALLGAAPNRLVDGDSVQVAVKNVADLFGNRIGVQGVLTNVLPVTDGVPPTVTDHKMTGRGFELTFSEPMDAATATDFANYVVQCPLVPPTTISAASMTASYDAGTRKLTVKLTGTNSFPYGATYRIQVLAVRDANGNAANVNGTLEQIGFVDSRVELLAGLPGALGSSDGTIPPADAVRFWNPAGCVFLSDKRLLLADRENWKLRILNAAGTTFTSLNAAGFSLPVAIAARKDVSSGPNFLHIADIGNHMLFAYNGTTITSFTAGGSGYTAGPTDRASALFSGPAGLARVRVGSNNDTLYIADSGNNVIRKLVLDAVDPLDENVVSTFAGAKNNLSGADGTGAAASFHTPYDVAVDPTNTWLYVADRGNHRIRRITLANAEVETFAGTVAGFADGATAAFNMPSGVAVDAAGFVYVADTGNNRIRRISPVDRSTTTVAGATVGTLDGAGSTAQFNGPLRIAIHPDTGDLYVTDSNNHTIRLVKP